MTTPGPLAASIDDAVDLTQTEYVHGSRLERLCKMLNQGPQLPRDTFDPSPEERPRSIVEQPLSCALRVRIREFARRV